MSGSEESDRAERLRQRRSRREQAETAEPSESSELSEPSEQAEQDEPGEQAETDEQSEPSEPSVKERTGKYVYIVADLDRRLDLALQDLRTVYARAFDVDTEAIEKNRHFWPLVIEYGISEVEELDADEVRQRLQDLDTVPEGPP